ncbi:hypothetical protein GGS26DRAFT_4906 [Hypomontagnella submonticulosa]|nr:hypothetical protein GGS26DRAFT_4906 [Hypomontagnella submonticulosa]
MSVSPEVAAIITRKKQHYCRLADTNQWPKLLETVVLPEAKYEFYQSNGELMNHEGIQYAWSTSADWAKFFSDLFTNLQVIHVAGPGDFEQINPDEVKAIWGVIYHAGKKGSDTEWHHTGGGHYYETWKRKGDDWFISHLRFERTYFKPLA